MAKKIVDIVIPFKNVGDPDELRIALRSIEKNAKFNYRIVIIGDLPPFVNLDKVDKEKLIFIPTNFPRAQENPKAWDLIWKLIQVSENPEINDIILMTYDDVIFLNPIYLKDISETIALRPIPKDLDFETNGSAAWKRVFNNTQIALKRNNFDPAYDFETHLPRFFQKSKLKALFDKYGFKKRPYCIPTLYYNENLGKKFRVLSEDPGNIKIALQYENDHLKYLEAIETHKFLNYGEKAWGPLLKDFLFELFPDPSGFESL